MQTVNRTLVNVACSILVLAANVAISLILSPFIVETVGIEANGFVSLANNCVTYAQLIVMALNSMSARFVSIAYARGDYRKANLYYNSVFWGKLIVVAALVVPAALCVVKLELLFDVPSDILLDVKLLFALVFFNFFISTGLPNWDCATYATNRLDRSYIPQALAGIVRCLLLLALFSCLVPRVWYVGAAASVMTIMVLVANAYNTRKLTPELRVGFRRGRRMCSRAALAELVMSGIWNSVANVGTILLSGLDILLCNTLIGATAMGYMALSKNLPILIQQLAGSICNAFAPELTLDYARGDRKRLLADIDRAIVLTSCIMTVPLSGIIVLGDRFYHLWVPAQNADLLWVLSVLAVLGYAFTSGTQILYNVFATMNRVKPNALAVLLCGVASIVIVVFLVENTELGLFAVAGVSTVVNLVRNMVFTLPMTAHYLGCPWYRFYPSVGKTMLDVAILVVLGFVIKPWLPDGSWVAFSASAILFAVAAFLFNFFFFLDSESRSAVLRRFRIIPPRS